ncbi:hypothetical protein DFH06DRAFT_545008 [Mycena polygramma]|nr:hypothetical protein DFH06DRAFT_545008 [Mycena polygramma]
MFEGTADQDGLPRGSTGKMSSTMRCLRVYSTLTLVEAPGRTCLIYPPRSKQGRAYKSSGSRISPGEERNIPSHLLRRHRGFAWIVGCLQTVITIFCRRLVWSRKTGIALGLPIGTTSEKGGAARSGGSTPPQIELPSMSRKQTRLDRSSHACGASYAVSISRGPAKFEWRPQGESMENFESGARMKSKFEI